MCDVSKAEVCSFPYITHITMTKFRHHVLHLVSKDNRLLLLTFCLLLLPLWESVIVLCFVVCYFKSILVLHHLDGEERAGCFA